MRIVTRGFCFRLEEPPKSIKYSNKYLSRKVVPKIGLRIPERNLVTKFGEFKLGYHFM
jgi:hypothetical protein